MRASYSLFLSLAEGSISSWLGRWLRDCVWNSSLEYAYLFMTFTAYCL